MKLALLLEQPGPVTETHVTVSNSAIAEVRSYVSYNYIQFRKCVCVCKVHLYILICDIIFHQSVFLFKVDF